MRLGDLISIKHGFAFKGEFFSTLPTNNVLLTPGNFNIGGGFKSDKNKYYEGPIPPEFILQADYLIVTMTDLSKEGDTLGYSALIPADSKHRYLHNQRIGLVQIANPDMLDKHFLYWFMRTKRYHYQILGSASGSTVKHTSPSRICDIEIAFPPLLEQKKIAHLLDCIEQKINLNTVINDNLADKALIIFKEWFIDNPSAASWKEGTFSDLIERTISGDWGKDAPSGNNTEMVYCIRGADIPEVRAGNKGKMPIRYILQKNFATKHLEAGDIVVEISGGSPTQSTGRAAEISDSLLKRYAKGMVCTNFCRALKPISGYSMYVYHYWQYFYNKGIFFNFENGTTGIKNLDLNGFIETQPINIAPDNLVIKFDTLCQSIYSAIYANGMENERLSLLRDTLLPKLLSGEIDISNIGY